MNKLDPKIYLNFNTVKEGKKLLQQAELIHANTKAVSKARAVELIPDIAEIKLKIREIKDREERANKIDEKDQQFGVGVPIIPSITVIGDSKTDPNVTTTKVETQISIDEYKERVAEYQDIITKETLPTVDIITKYWYGVTGKHKNTIRITLRNFLLGRGYKNAYDETYGFMAKVDEFMKIYYYDKKKK